MATKQELKPQSLANLKPAKKGEIRNPYGIGGRKKELETLFKQCVTKDEWKAIIAKGVEQTMEGDNKAREFLFSYAYGKPNVMIDLVDSKGSTFIQNNFNVDVKGKGEDELNNLLIELSNDVPNEDDSDVEILE